MNHTEIARWLSSYIGKGRPYTSPRNLSLRAGLSQNTVGNIIDAGSGDPASLIALADHLREARANVMIMAGWLRPEDVVPDLSPDEAKMISDVRRLERVSERGLNAIRGLLEELLVPPVPLGGQRRVAEEAESHQAGPGSA